MKNLQTIAGVGPVLAAAMVDAGFETVADVARADSNALLAVRGIGPGNHQAIVTAARGLVDADQPGPAQDEAAAVDAQGKKKKKKKKKSGKGKKRKKAKDAKATSKNRGAKKGKGGKAKKAKKTKKSTAKGKKRTS